VRERVRENVCGRDGDGYAAYSLLLVPVQP
jgi:hypothetical protein